ncbi:unnamed protein product [Rhizophagus irregularis]|nr:unnamed protein product [Rhizophagus irregularis]
MTITTITTTEETKDTTTTELDLEEVTVSTIEANSEKNTKGGQERDIIDMEKTITEDTTKKGMKNTEDTEHMADIEWLEAINWEPYTNSTTEEEKGDKGEEGDEKEPIIKEKQKKNNEVTKKINKNQKKNKNKIEKNNTLKIGCINVRGMND